MASDDTDGVSLFEGMVLFSPTDLSSSSPPSTDPPPPAAPPPLPPSPPPPPPTTAESQPLDEDLFSDLTLQSQPQPETLPIASSSAPELEDPSPPFTTTAHHQPPSRQISRKKKKAVRIGYANNKNITINNTSTTIQQREDDEEEVHVHPVPKSQPDQQTEETGTQEHPREHENESAPPPAPTQQKHSIGRVISWKEDAPLGSIEDKLHLVRSRISEKHHQIRETAALLSSKRKDLGRRRRKAAADLDAVSARFKEIERELEEACEAEDFEAAERLSESLAAAEKDRDLLLGEVRDAESECDALDLKMQELLDLQIAAEEQGVALLQQFAKDAADYADLVLKNAEDVSSKELEEWQSAAELLEVDKIEMDIESHLISDARSGLENSIEHFVENDRKEVECLRRKKDVLAKELDDLLALVRLKEAEIAENDSQIQTMEAKISNVISEFEGSKSSINMKHENLQQALSKIESETEALAIRKKDIDEFMLLAQNKISKLKELSIVSLDEAKTCQDLVGLRKSVASSILRSREDKVKLAKSEETILEQIQILRQQTSAARTTLQELSSARANVQQEFASFKQRIDFIDKRGPELEAEKKVAAAARNFKEAGRIAAEAKALNVEKESLQSKKEKAVSDLQKLEEEIKDTVDEIQESEGLVLLKEKEAAMAGYKRLRLVAAAARAERSAALEMGDAEEGEILLKEAETAESKARELQETYDLEPEEEHEKTMGHFVSITFVTNLAGQHLAEMAASFNLP